MVINLQFFGGRGGSSGVGKSGISALQAFKENARQFNEALQQGKIRKASVVEFEDITGNETKRYWNGATYVDRKSALYEKDMHGTYKARFKK